MFAYQRLRQRFLFVYFPVAFASSMLLALVAVPASGAPLDLMNYTSIAGDMSTKYEKLLLGEPGVNEAGVVVFSAFTTAGPITFGNPGVFTGSGGALTTVVTPADGVFDAAVHPSISDTGRVAFFGQPSAPGRNGIFSKDSNNPATPATTIALDGFSGPSGNVGVVDLSCLGGCDIANDGTVIFNGSLDVGG
ncbi:MAG: hypothetical protein ACREUA_05435, partial [Burkholderiales bacterium]